MKRSMLVAITMLLLAGAVHAEGMGGLGFRTLGGTGGSPALGIRQWLNERWGFDAAVGFTSGSSKQGTPLVTTDEQSGVTFDMGVPISAKKWDKVNVLFRPGFSYGRLTQKNTTNPTPPNEVKLTTIAVSGDIEVEWMVAEKLSVSAAHGISWVRNKAEDNDTPPSEFQSSQFRTGGNNFTSFGFHVYLW